MNDLYEDDLNNLKYLGERIQPEYKEKSALINFYQN